MDLIEAVIRSSDTKTTGNIAELAAILEATKRGILVSIPYGDNLPYDFIFDVDGKLIKIQVKHAYRRGNRTKTSYLCRTFRQTKSGRRYYSVGDFDFALIYVDYLSVFWIMPFDIFSSFRSNLTINTEQEVSTSMFRDRWDLLQESFVPVV